MQAAHTVAFVWKGVDVCSVLHLVRKVTCSHTHMHTHIHTHAHTHTHTHTHARTHAHTHTRIHTSPVNAWCLAVCSSLVCVVRSDGSSHFCCLLVYLFHADCIGSVHPSSFCPAYPGKIAALPYLTQNSTHSRTIVASLLVLYYVYVIGLPSVLRASCVCM